MRLKPGQPTKCNAEQRKNRRRAGHLAAAKNKAQGTSFFDNRIRRMGGKVAAPIINAQRWISLTSGMISSPGALGSHHRKIQADKNAKLKLTEEQYKELVDLPMEMRLEQVHKMCLIAE